MLHFINDYSLNIGERVECYYNSKKQVISIRSIDSRNENQSKIVAYAEFLHLENATFTYCATNKRKIIKGIYAGMLPVVPKLEMQVQHNGEHFVTVRNEQVIGSRYAVFYKGLILAEEPVIVNKILQRSV